MFNNIKLTGLLSLAILVGFSSCKKEEYSFGELKTPTNLNLTTAIAGLNVSNPAGNGTGNVTVTVTAEKAISYRINYGDGITEMVPSGNITHRYTNPGTNNYTIIVNAVGTGGITSTISRTIRVFVDFEIPTDILNTFTNGSSRTFITDKDAVGHFGVGPADGFGPSYYAAGPNTREACAYDDQITFTKDPLNRILMTINNNGSSFSIGASTSFYGVSGGDGCYAGISTTGTRQLAFMAATSASTPAQSTRIQFMVPGNGIINFGTGGTVYEILGITPTTIHLRNIGSDGNSWYQKLKVKP